MQNTEKPPKVQNDTKNDTARKFVKTAAANLYRGPLGQYFMHAKICGNLVRKSLKTTSFEIAKVKLRKLHADETERLAKVKEHGEIGDGTFGSLAADWLKRSEEAVDIKPNTKRYRRQCLAAILKSWPELSAMRTEAVSRSQCLDWAAGYRKKYSSTRHNGSIDILKALFEIAVERGVRLDNPADKLAKAPVKQKELHLPSVKDFAAMLANMDGHGARHRASITVRFLAFTGMRITEAGLMTPDWIDGKEIRIPGAVTKNGKERRVPIIAELEPLLKKLLSEHESGPLLPARNPQKCLKFVCKTLGLSKLTPHDLRHLFITRCIESGVDVKTIATWVGHQDGGALILKTYAHLRNEHSVAMAAKVKFM